MLIILDFEAVKLIVKLNNTVTAQKLSETTPFNSITNKKQGMLYFNVPLAFGAENLTLDVETGDVVYLQEGPALIIFFGKTEFSATEKPISPKLATKIGQVISGLELIDKITDKFLFSVKLS
ncbi:MAG: cyclophilin-like family protein [bacterium]